MGYKGTTSGRFIDNLPSTIEAIQDDANKLKGNMADLEDELGRCLTIATGNVLTEVDYNTLNEGRRTYARILAGDPNSLYDQPTRTTILWTNGAVSSIVCCSQRSRQSGGWSMFCAMSVDTGKEVIMLRVYFNYTSANNTLTLQKV